MKKRDVFLVLIFVYTGQQGCNWVATHWVTTNLVATMGSIPTRGHSLSSTVPFPASLHSLVYKGTKGHEVLLYDFFFRARNCIQNTERIF